METSLMNASPEAFDAIRPYRDEEVREVLDRLPQDPELLRAILRFKFPRLADSFLAPALRWMISRALASRVIRIGSISDLQVYVGVYMARMIATTTRGFTVDGIEHLDKNKSYLFISNHRDIAMDPAFVNYALHINNMDTVRIAIGDNLLKKPYVNDLMRLNKSFIVQRSAKGIRQMMAAFNLLSQYIHHSIKQEHQSIWIAQKEGRAKDGIDHTDPAIIKMFCMAEKKSGKAFADTIHDLNIVPVALSYEYDPLDVQKSREVVQKQKDGHYAKGEFEDIDSIAQGIAGYKGRVHVAFGQPLDGDFEDADAVAAAVDEQIRRLYRLFPSNYLALEALHQEGDFAIPSFDTEVRAAFNERLAACPEEYQAQWLAMYANPVKNFLGRL
ncbi:1-acyl-sn-glycerol-3-phosphate acyltransferase [Marinospirillum alkaliphilum]|uniref:Glycerol-3-phosphate acyltransferase n=1 Tax=Marinospirillum alkaliphilum DSM 21637 TaxID=1122209 RepID=A0A1K1TJP1_9GAMM|nr:1-acyl-sn-glycerol-3-phosphate acyltransferase [Marinospirillum alkaliphilum]SFX00776.1 glycerol-3-phosphate acyltransferase [Marinospirillum alkaliphilum DSM 21637]